MTFNPFAQVKDYESMLYRIFAFTSITAGICTWLIRSHFPDIDDVLGKLDFPVSVLGIDSVPILGCVIPAVVVAGAFRVLKLHDRISDIFRIRLRFDVCEIIIYMGRAVKANVGTWDYDNLYAQRSNLMQKVFYRYVSSTDPQIDKHLIYQALDWWSWYWVVVESLVILLPTSVVLLFNGGERAGVWILVTSLVLTCVGLPFFYFQARRYAQNEVDEILRNPKRFEEVRQELHAL